MMVLDSSSGRSLYIKHYAQDDYLTVQIFKTSWNIKERTTLSVYARFDSTPAWTANAIGGHNVVEWYIAGSSFAKFTKEFGESTILTVGFPQGTERPWTVYLTGTAAIVNVWKKCMSDTQFTNTSPAPTSPAPASPAPTSPAPTTKAPSTNGQQGGIPL
jgi:hypothetical protein